jgi:hypothetical protein
MYVCHLMDFVLFEPPTHTARRRIVSVTGLIALMHLLDCVPQQDPFGRVHVRDISPYSVSECHGGLQWLVVRM